VEDHVFSYNHTHFCLEVKLILSVISIVFVFEAAPKYRLPLNTYLQTWVGVVVELFVVFVEDALIEAANIVAISLYI